MIAVDTNVVVRYLTADDPIQSPAARALVDHEDILFLTTVALETEWVLRSVYALPPSEVASRIASFAGLPTVRVEQPAELMRALDHFRAGLDFADALHLVGAGGCDGFVTFDRRLVARAGALSEIAVRSP